MSKAKIKPNKMRSGLGSTIRNGLLLAAFLAVPALTGSALSQSLNVVIRDLIRLPSRNAVSTVTVRIEPVPPATGDGAGSLVRIEPMRPVRAKTALVPAAAAPAQAQAKAAGPRMGRLEAAFDPTRFDKWDRKHLPDRKKSGGRETWVLVAGLAFQYDSNLYRNPTEDDPAVGQVTDVDDGSIIGWAGAEYRIDMGQGLDSGIRLEVRSQRYFEESRADTAAISLGAFIHDRRSWGGLVLPYTYTYWWDDSGFAARASVHAFRPMAYWLAFQNYRLEATAVYENRNYFDQTHDAHRVGLQLGHRYDLPRPGSYIRLDKRLSNDFAGDEGYLLAEFTLSGGLPLWKGLRLDGGVTYAHFWFDDRPAAEIGQAGTGEFSRQDNQFRANARLFYQISPVWQVGLDYVLTLNSSNVESDGGCDPYDFHKHVFTILASGRF